eukprot:scaffold92064_cov55-Attheya_sp.AAC.1
MIPQHFFLRRRRRRRRQADDDDDNDDEDSIHHHTVTCVPLSSSPSDWHPLCSSPRSPTTTRRSHHPDENDLLDHTNNNIITCQFEGTDPLSDLLRAEAASHNQHKEKHKAAIPTPSPTRRSKRHETNNGGQTNYNNNHNIQSAWRGWDQESANVMRAFGSGGTNKDQNRNRNSNSKSCSMSSSLLDARMEDLSGQLMALTTRNNHNRNGMTGRPDELVRVLERSLRYLTFHANGLADQSILARVEWMTTYPAL